MAFDTAQFDIVFDKLTDKIKTELNEQYNAKRILGNEYATVYAQLMDRALQLAYSDQVTQAEILLKAAQEQNIQAETSLKATQESELVSNGIADRALKESQKLLYDRQKKGFDDNVKQKLFDSQVNSWGLMFSSGMLEEKPDFITNNAVTTLYNDILSGINGV
jgi:hypothetical protein